MEDENQSVPSAEASAPEPLSFDGALDLLNAADEPVETPAATETAEAEGAVDEADQADAQTETEAEPDAEPEAELVLHGNAKTRLRDGREVTLGELKKRFEKAEELEAKLPEFETRQREIEQKAQAIAAQEQFFTNTINQAKAVLQQNAPPRPDFAAYERGEIDIITYTEQQARWNAFAAKWQQLDQAQKAQAQKAEAEKAENLQQWRKEQRAKLVEKAPEFASDDALKALSEDGRKYADHWGLTDDDVSLFDRAALLLMAKDAIAYRKLQDAKPKVLEKTKDVPPVQVQAPGRRVSQQEKQAASVKTDFNRLRHTRSVDDALAILNQYDL